MNLRSGSVGGELVEWHASLFDDELCLLSVCVQRHLHGAQVSGPCFGHPYEYALGRIAYLDEATALPFAGEEPGAECASGPQVALECPQPAAKLPGIAEGGLHLFDGDFQAGLDVHDAPAISRAETT